MQEPDDNRAAYQSLIVTGTRTAERTGNVWGQEVLEEKLRSHDHSKFIFPNESDTSSCGERRSFPIATHARKRVGGVWGHRADGAYRQQPSQRADGVYRQPSPCADGGYGQPSQCADGGRWKPSPCADGGYGQPSQCADGGRWESSQCADGGRWQSTTKCA